MSYAIVQAPLLSVRIQKWDVPANPHFLRVFLLGLSSKKAAGLAGDLSTCLDEAMATRRVRPGTPPPLPTDPPPDGRAWDVWWDGSHHPDGTAGLGITLRR